MNNQSRLFLILWLFIAGAPSFLIRGQAPSDLQVEADQLNYEAEDNTITARGNVLLRKGAQSLKADVITYNQVTEQAFARGNVVFTNKDQIWRGEVLKYNFITGKGSFPDLGGTVGPFKIKADSVERLNPIQTQLEGVMVTTCEETVDPDFKIQASKVDVYEEDIYIMRNPVFYLHGIPFFYLPKLTLDQQRQPTNFDVIPGYSSRDGVMLLTKYTRYPKPGYWTETDVDYRSNRGPAVGQGFFWKDPETNRQQTLLKFYGSLDDAPYRSPAQKNAYNRRGINIEEERYRIKFEHRQNFTPTDTFWAKASYLSDAKVIDDFFDDEFRDEPIPETRIAYSSVAQNWNANIDLTRQLNQDEFSSVNRLPEATFNIPTMSVGSTELLYQSETRAGYLERTFSEFDRDNGNEDYDSLRLFTEQIVSYPTKNFGWLNIIPRVGGSLTYYGNTNNSETQIDPVSSVDENGVITTVLETNTVQSVGSADIRILPELGFETSFKAFGMIHDQPTAVGKGLRHVVEPFANYTFIPEPDLTPNKIYQFDDIDERGEEHNIAFGIRNKWQTKRELPDGHNQIHDLVNVIVSTEYDLRSEADPALGNILVDTELKLVDWAFARVEFLYDVDQGEFNSMKSEIRFKHPESENFISLTQRYRLDDIHTLQLNYQLNPGGGRFGFRGYTRYELESEGFEEQEIMFTLVTECVGYGFGGKWELGDQFANGTSDDDDYEIWFQLWLTAFPRAIFGTGDGE